MGLGEGWGSSSEFHGIGAAQTYAVEKRAIRLESEDGGAVEVVSWARGVIRVRYAPNGRFHENGAWALARREPEPDAPDFALEEPAGRLVCAAGPVTVGVELEPVRLSFFDAEGNVLLRDTAAGGLGRRRAGVRCELEMPAGERFYGLGEKTGPLDKRGERLVMWNADVTPHLPTTDPMYQSIPFVLGRRRGEGDNGVAGGGGGALFYGIFVNNSFRSHFDFGKETAAELGGVAGAWSLGADGGDLDYFFLAGPRPQDVLARYTALTGRMPLPPRWALGNHQSRWGYPSAERVLAVAEEFRRRDIPCDAVWLDIDYMDGFRVFTWDPRRFSDPAGLVAKLSAKGFRAVTIVDPGVKVDEEGYAVYREGVEKGLFVAEPSGRLFVGDVWPGPSAFPDFAREQTRRWWGENLRALVDKGVAGIWNDMNEPAVFRRGAPTGTMPENVEHVETGEEAGEAETGSGAQAVSRGRARSHAEIHNVYGLLMAEATYEGLRRLRPQERPFVLTRAGFAGIQRYAAVWTGDNASWWEHLAMAVPMCLNLGLSGVPFVGTDIGGFGYEATAELYARWVEAGALMPFCRTHSAFNTRAQEPWAFGADVEEIARKYLKLRYRLLPYFYSVFWEAAQTGKPVLRPLVFEYPEDERAAVVGGEFLVGAWLLAAPVAEKGARSRLVYLPRGVWYHWWSGRRFEGPGEFVVEAPLGELPLFARAGSVIPMGPEMNFTEEKPLDPLTLAVWPGGEAEAGAATDGAFWFYEDDGKSTAYENGAYALRTLACARAADGSGDVIARIGAREGDFEPGPRRVEVRVYGEGAASEAGPPAAGVPEATAAEAAAPAVAFAETKDAVELRISLARSR